MKSEKQVIVQQVIMRPLADLVPNPKNPRTATDEEIAALAESIKANPDYFDARPIVLSNRTGVMMIIDGEQRSKAAKLLGMVEVPTILMEGLTEEREDEVMVRANTHSGVWDNDKLLALKQQWGGGIVNRGAPKKETEKLADAKYVPMYYEPKQKPDIKLIDCIDFTKFIAKRDIVKNSALPEMLKETLLWFCYRFLKIDFESVANYYYFNATEPEKEIIERLRLVLVDGGDAGFIEDDLLRLCNVNTESND